MTKGHEKAIAVLAVALREHISINAELTDEEVVKKYISADQVGYLAAYFDCLLPTIERIKAEADS